MCDKISAATLTSLTL